MKRVGGAVSPESVRDHGTVEGTLLWTTTDTAETVPQLTYRCPRS